LKLSMMVMSQTLPFIIFGIFGGAYSDKHNKKKILYLSDLIVKSRLLCKMLYNVFTISTYQN
ncbi:hypothetical protein, partial [Klebsiella pneumoniae]|uniref:hypothetical protein n=1 Tax=Klebsiella pneumoniae TaxID=573 RepID=UPI00223FE068